MLTQSRDFPQLEMISAGMLQRRDGDEKSSLDSALRNGRLFIGYWDDLRLEPQEKSLLADNSAWHAASSNSSCNIISSWDVGPAITHQQAPLMPNGEMGFVHVGSGADGGPATVAKRPAGNCAINPRQHGGEADARRH